MDVEHAFAEIVVWCERYAPRTAAAIRPAADEATLRRAVAATAGRWPDDLLAWYRLMDGTERTPDGYLLPSYCPLPLDSVMAHWTMWQEIWQQIRDSSRDEERDRRLIALGGVPEDPDDAFARLQTQPAGTAAGMFLPSFVPIAEDQSGADLFVDARPGDAHGCVTEFVKGDADSRGPRWPSVTAMLTDVAEALRAGRPVGHWHPAAEDGALR